MKPRPPAWWLLVTCLLAALTAPVARAQTSLQMSQLQNRYRVAKRAAALDAARTAELAKLEAAATAARLRGENGLAFRELQRGLALLENRPWTAELAFTTSLVLVPGATVCDPAQPLPVQIRQLYPAALEASTPLTAQVMLGRVVMAPEAKAKMRDARAVGTFPGVGDNLAQEPFRFTVVLSALEDGLYQLGVELRDGGRVVHRLSAPLVAMREFGRKREETEARLAKVAGFDQAKASIRYPFDYARVLNSGTIELTPFDFRAELERGAGLLRSIEAGVDPFPAERGTLARHYHFEEAGEIMPYRVVVPRSYDGSKPLPLVVALHGMGGTENTFIQLGNGALPRLAEERGFLVTTPLGYRRNGGYGRPGGGPLGALDPETARMVRLSELDVLNVVRQVRANYRVDPARIYLMGHSMGGGGTWVLGSRHAEIWAGLAPIASGGAAPGLLPLANLKQHGIPVYLVHGDADRTAPVEVSRAMAAELRNLGVQHEYHEIPGGTHGDVVGPAIPKIVDFFGRHARK
jgi:dienelactone hydrolase